MPDQNYYKKVKKMADNGGAMPTAPTDEIPLPPGAPQTLEEAGLSPEEARGMEQTIDEANAAMAEAGLEDEGEAKPSTEDMAVLAEAIGVDVGRAAAVYEAAQAHPKLRGKSVAEVAEILAADYYLKAEILKLAGDPEGPPPGPTPPEMAGPPEMPGPGMPAMPGKEMMGKGPMGKEMM